MTEPVFLGPAEILPRSQGASARGADRYPCDLRPLVPRLLRPSYGGLHALVRDISAVGIGLMVDRRLEAGSLLAVHLGAWRAGESSVLLAEVVHATAQPDGGWLIGCKLSRPLQGQELESFLER
jgi:hypothetical protein